MNTFKLTIITPEKEIYSGSVKMLKSKNSVGEFEILSNHSSFITSTVPTITTFEDEKKVIHSIFTSVGVMNFKDGELTFCVDVAENAEDIDIERAEKAKERAEQRLSEKNDIDVERAQIALSRAIVRLQFANKK